MMRAVYRDGKIEPVDAIPSDWREGDELVINALPSATESLEDWVAELNAASADITDEDHERFMAAIAEHRADAKKWMRRSMGLPE
jgi:hypothetical protein